MGRLTMALCWLLLLLLTTQACYITNCPRGGKRDVDDGLGVRPCMFCSFGQCVGPHICCGAGGCEIGTLEASTCHEENENPIPCHVFGDRCLLKHPGNVHGNCVSPGVCCTDDTCSMHVGCL
uniref:Conopressin-conophysin n=1 Tax=Conus bayani TaxID=2070216 RepID=CESSA_CONBY|nr:RecName: Full=Conopressin-conophysin; Contains: RecName: Full=Conopressin-ba1a; AltName: Full=Conopressin-ba1c; Contains: RecName: Full=Conopressin-ba1b; Contains: RecName: Full=Conophysin ba1; Flags: Precursor [Conus bayani]